MTRLRWAVFVWDRDGDMGDAIVLGPYRDDSLADRKAETIRRLADRASVTIDCMVVPVESGDASAEKAINLASSPKGNL